MKQANKQNLIRAALTHIAFEGWAEYAFTAAEKAEGWKAGTYAVHFPGGVQDFISAFQDWVDDEMCARLASDPAFETAKVREKIFAAVMARLHVLTPYREAARRLHAHQLLPWNGPLAIRSLARTADAMWKAAGDRSTDYNYYTKRMLLSGVYASTLQKWFSDESQGFADTHEFLKQRIENVLRFGKAVADVKARFRGKKAA